MSKVRKAVIPAAGLGTRFLPATKTTPKEMLPLVDKPIILYVVEEAVRSGIEDIIIIAGRGKTSIEDFFDTSYEVEDQLDKSGKQDMLASLKEISSMANIISIRQKEAKGLGHAVYSAAPIVGDEPFAVLLGDEVNFTDDGNPTVTGVLAKEYEATGISHVNVIEVPKEDTSKYGIINPGEKNEKGDVCIYEVKDLVEKPNVAEAPSQLALPGRYVFNAKIFDYLKNTAPGKNGEIQLTDAMIQLAKNEGLKAITMPSQRFDAGDKLGFLMANVELALKRDELRAPLIEHLQIAINKYS